MERAAVRRFTHASGWFADVPTDGTDWLDERRTTLSVRAAEGGIGSCSSSCGRNRIIASPNDTILEPPPIAARVRFAGLRAGRATATTSRRGSTLGIS